jgi:hypothetical protein
MPRVTLNASPGQPTLVHYLLMSGCATYAICTEADSLGRAAGYRSWAAFS